MRIDEAISHRRTVRAYRKRVPSIKLLDQLIEAAVWAPSAHNLQPWYFVVMRDQARKAFFIRKLLRCYRKFYGVVNLEVRRSIEIMAGAPVLILAFNTCRLSKGKKKFGKAYYLPAYLSEIQSVAAALENMHLTATRLGLGMAWLTTPLFIKEDIERSAGTEHDLVAVATVGYAREKGAALPRKPRQETVTYW